MPPPINVVLAGQLTDPAFASAARGFFSAMAKGARPVEPRPVITGDKAADIAAIMADPFAAYDKPVAQARRAAA